LASRRVNIETKKEAESTKINIKPTVDKTKNELIVTAAKYPLNMKRPPLIFNEKIGRFFSDFQ
jgi:hypothetical protein